MHGARLQDALRAYTAISLSRAEDYRCGQLAVLGVFGGGPPTPAREAHSLRQRMQEQEALRDRKEDEIWAQLDGAFVQEGGGGGGGCDELQWAACVGAVDAAILGRVKAILGGCRGVGWRRDKKAQRQLALLYRFMPNLSLADPQALAHRATAALRAHSAGLRQHMARAIDIACGALSPGPEALQAIQQDVACDVEYAGKLLDYTATLQNRLLLEAQAASMAVQPRAPPTPTLQRSSSRMAASGGRGLQRQGALPSGSGPTTTSASKRPTLREASAAAPFKGPLAPLLSQLQLVQPAPQVSIPEELSTEYPGSQQQQQQQQQQHAFRRALPATGSRVLQGSAQRPSLHPTASARQQGELNFSASARTGAGPIPALSFSRLEELSRNYSPRTSKELRRAGGGGGGGGSSGAASAFAHSSGAGGGAFPPPPSAPSGYSLPESQWQPIYLSAAATDFELGSSPTPTPSQFFFGEREVRALGEFSGSSEGAGSARSRYYSGLSDMIAQALAPPSSATLAPRTRPPPPQSPTLSTAPAEGSSFKAAAGSWLQARGITLPVAAPTTTTSSGKGSASPKAEDSAVNWQRVPLSFEAPRSPLPHLASPTSKAPGGDPLSAAIALARSAIAQHAARSTSPIYRGAAAAGGGARTTSPTPFLASPPSPTPMPPRQMSTLAADAVAELALGKSMSHTNKEVFLVAADGGEEGRGSPIRSILTDRLRL